MTIKFMGVQDDPDIDNAEGRGFPRIYDGTKRSMLDDIYDFLRAVDEHHAFEGELGSRARGLMRRIDRGER